MPTVRKIRCMRGLLPMMWLGCSAVHLPTQVLELGLSGGIGVARSMMMRSSSTSNGLVTYRTPELHRRDGGLHVLWPSA